MRRLVAIVALLLLSPLATAQYVSDVAPDTAHSGAVPAWLAPAEAWSTPLRVVNSAQRPDADVPSVWVRPSLNLQLPGDTLNGNHVIQLGNNQTHAVAIRLASPAWAYYGLRLDSVSHSTWRSASCARLVLDCAGQYQAWRGGSLLGGLRSDRIAVGLGLAWLEHNPGNGRFSAPMTEQSRLLGVPSQWVESFNRIKASGRMELGDSGTHVNVGASIGRLRLLPKSQRLLQPSGLRVLSHFANGIHLDSIDQKAIQLGVGKGAVSGTLTGRFMQPEGVAPGAAGKLHSWSALDLGITVRLPWQGKLSLGAQNLWSSGDDEDLSSKQVDPIQGRIPYIRYHQKL